MLDGSKSKDSDGKNESYLWQQISGPSIAPDNANDIGMRLVSPKIGYNACLGLELLQMTRAVRFRDYCSEDYQ